VRLAMTCNDISGVPTCAGSAGDFAVALNAIRERAIRAMLDAAGLIVDGKVARQLVAAGDSVGAVVTLYNGGASTVVVRRVAVSAGNTLAIMVRDSAMVLAPDSSLTFNGSLQVLRPTYHWWQINGLIDGTYLHDLRSSRDNPVIEELITGEDRLVKSRVEATFALGGVNVPVIVQPLAYRTPSTLRGDARHPLTGVPATSVLLERNVEYERAALPINRLFRVYLWSARSTEDTLLVRLRLPAGLTADSATRTVTIPPFGARDVFFRLRGRLRPGADTIAATATRAPSAGRSPEVFAVRPVTDFRLGVVMHEYPHLPSLPFVRFSNDLVRVVDLRVPPRLHVAYIKGTDDVQMPLGQLQINFQTLEPSLLSVVDLSGFTTILIGVNALRSDALVGAVPTLREFMRTGGTVVVLPGGDEIGRSGLLPYPIRSDSAQARLTENAMVKALDGRSQLLRWPNALSASDFDDWIGDRARNVPTAFDARYHSVLSLTDPGQLPSTGTILTATVGKGIFVYTSLSLDQQLAAASSGAARLIVNLMAAGLRPERAN
jgi:hypothetical protein